MFEKCENFVHFENSEIKQMTLAGLCPKLADPKSKPKKFHKGYSPKS